LGRCLLCGPSQQEKNLEAAQASFSETLQQDYSTQFAEQQGILNNLNSVLQPIVSAGPDQQGYGPQELSALNTEAIESNAQGVNQAEKAYQAKENSAGGGTTLLPSGANAQINAEIGSAAESNLSSEQLGITTNNYTQGRQNWQNALSGELGVSSQTNPLGYASAGTSANSSAFNEADTINQQSNQAFSDILGGVGSIASGMIPLIPHGGSSSSNDGFGPGIVIP
jgi:hypothetical protein